MDYVDKLLTLCQYLEEVYAYHVEKSEGDSRSRYGANFSYGAAFAYKDVLKQLYADFFK